ncbi:hypothetical protein DFQ29_010004 [Apophysomyces sp. BC1021]|nr:hypothetical protein DFQ29_010004 [Apophysomyces sp. BC1021]
MWAGAMIPYVIQRLTLLLLRFSLAPEREKNTYSTRKRNQEARNKDKKCENTPSIATIDWRIKYQSRRLRKLEDGYLQMILQEEDELDEVLLNDEDMEWERSGEEDNGDEEDQKDDKKEAEDGEEVLAFRSHQAARNASTYMPSKDLLHSLTPIPEGCELIFPQRKLDYSRPKSSFNVARNNMQ